MFQTSQGLIKPIVYMGIVNSDRLLLVKYRVSPNPTKHGWWIPAPGLEFGGDPLKTAQRACQELGYSQAAPKLHHVESFETPGGWHLIFHYVAQVTAPAQLSKNILETKWVDAHELEAIPDIAHGSWEKGVGQSYLG